ncbi:hypothetical protein HDU98_002994, partial [Podochytrium sp. JEL0797]
NLEDLVSEIQHILSHQISDYLLSEVNTVEKLSNIQAQLFETNRWSYSTPQRQSEMMQDMLVLLNQFKENTADIWWFPYPLGYNIGYYYPPQNPGQLLLWNQTDMTQYSWICDAQGIATGALAMNNTSFGDGTPQNPGNNETLLNAPGGTFGSNLDYSNNTYSTVTGIYPWQGGMYKTFLRIAVNSVTQEKIVFGNDWTMFYLSQHLMAQAESIPYQLFTGIIDASSGTVLAISSNATLVDTNGNSVPLSQIQDPFTQNFAQYLNASVGSAGNLTTQLSHILNELSNSNADELYIDRRFNGVNWRLSIFILDIAGGKHVLWVFLNIDQVESQVSKVSTQTGIIVLVIILAFLALGWLFSFAVSRQLRLVSTQIGLLKQLKFNEVLDKESGIKARSFVYELAGLQEAFHEMVGVFAATLKSNQQMQRAPTSSVRKSLQPQASAVQK